jgi:SAM-dependent methyltransferase
MVSTLRANRAAFADVAGGVGFRVPPSPAPLLRTCRPLRAYGELRAPLTPVDQGTTIPPHFTGTRNGTLMGWAFRQSGFRQGRYYELTLRDYTRAVAGPASPRIVFTSSGEPPDSCRVRFERNVTSDKRLISTSFPRSSQYHPEWVLASVSGGANSLWLTKWLASALNLRSGMRVLDLGCGRAASSVFLRREFGVQVWATDLWFSVSEKIQRIRDAGVEDGVFPIHADARSLPFATEFFDAIVSVDSFYYYGTDDLYLNYLARFVKPGGQIGTAGAGLVREIEGSLPEHLRPWWTQDLWGFHSPSWWRRHWERTGIMEIDVADTMPDGWQRWLDWHRVIAHDNELEIKTLEADRGDYLGYVRLVGRRRGETELADHFVSVPTQYTKTPLLRAKE